MTKNVKELIKTVGLFVSVLLLIGACFCTVVHAEVLLPDGTRAKYLSEGIPWEAAIHFNQEDGTTMAMTDSNICGYQVSVDPMAKVEPELQEMLDAKHLEIIEVNLVRFTDAEPWNATEPDVQSIYFVVNPEENHGDVLITWRTPGIDTNLAQGFRQSGPRCCFALSVNDLACYLYSPAFGGEGVARKHVGFNDNVLLVDDYLMGKLERIIQAF